MAVITRNDRVDPHVPASGGEGNRTPTDRGLEMPDDPERESSGRGTDGRFRKGHSGNPMGRPIKPRKPPPITPDLLTALTFELSKDMEVTIGSEVRLIPSHVAIAHKLKQDLLGRSIDRYRAFQILKSLGLGSALDALQDHLEREAEAQSQFAQEILENLVADIEQRRAENERRAAAARKQ